MKNEAHWIISSDGYYPYCSNCGNEPETHHTKTLPKKCPFCGLLMTNTDILNEEKTSNNEKNRTDC